MPSANIPGDSYLSITALVIQLHCLQDQNLLQPLHYLALVLRWTMCLGKGGLEMNYHSFVTPTVMMR